jgi:5-(carboxyamino)imidazole ribonucleotide mutase
MKKTLVAIIMGSDSDLPIMNDASEALNEFNIDHDIFIVSAHRTPDWMFRFAKSAHKKGYKLIIAGAGGAAHLPGMVASLTPLPVIGVPVQVGKLNGLDALLSIVQMPKGVPVATVAIDNSRNAGLLAVRILSLGDSKLLIKTLNFKKSQTTKIMNANRKLQKN